MTEKMPNNLPTEITVGEPVLKKNEDGKEYLIEQDGEYYGGDYLPKTPEKIDTTELPPAPEDKEPLVL